MSFEIIETLSLPGDVAKANEDAFAHQPHAAVVLDGATPLGDGVMPGPSDAKWIAEFGSRRLMAHLRDGDGARKALRAALADAKKSFEALRCMPPEDVWQTPSASMMLAVESEGEVEFLTFGDCAALVERNGKVTVVGENLEYRAAEAKRAQALAKEKGLSPAHGLSRKEFLTELRARRNKMNTGSYWLFTPEPKAASHAVRRVLKAAAGTHILLASDGFLALASDYGVYDAAALMAAAKAKGLAALGEELRAIEAGDPGGDKYARFKKSDDATAILLKMT